MLRKFAFLLLFMIVTLSWARQLEEGSSGTDNGGSTDASGSDAGDAGSEGSQSESQSQQNNPQQDQQPQPEPEPAGSSGVQVAPSTCYTWHQQEWEQGSCKAAGATEKAKTPCGCDECIRCGAMTRMCYSTRVSRSTGYRMETECLSEDEKKSKGWLNILWTILTCVCCMFCFLSIFSAIKRARQQQEEEESRMGPYGGSPGRMIVVVRRNDGTEMMANTHVQGQVVGANSPIDYGYGQPVGESQTGPGAGRHESQKPPNALSRPPGNMNH